MHQYRVTKYDPAYRDAAGAYSKDEWTSFGDVGHSFCGVTLSQKEYLRVESAYIEAAAAFLQQDGSPELRVVGLENRGGHANPPVEGAVVARKDLAAVCRSVLREQFWCRLEAEGRFVHFGWDYYMYVGVVGECGRAIGRAKALGLFVEEFDSPYYSTDEQKA